MEVTIEQAKNSFKKQGFNEVEYPKEVILKKGEIYSDAIYIYKAMQQFANHCIEEYKESLKDKLNGLSEYCFADDYKVIDLPLEEFMKAYDTKASLGQHLRMIGDLTCIGVNASIAGEKLKEALLKHWSK